MKTLNIGLAACIALFAAHAGARTWNAADACDGPGAYADDWKGSKGGDSVGGKGYVKTVSSYIREELSRRFDGIKFVVYDTSDRSLAKGRKVCVSGQLNLPGF